MNLVDANVLLYCVNESDPKHADSLRFVTDSLSAGETIGFAWVVLLAFLRLSTRVGLFPRPLAVEDALRIANSWLEHPAAVVAEPTTRHPRVLADLLSAVGTGGNLVNDAHLAALALEHDATIVSYDNDFGRFPGVRWRPPGSGPSSSSRQRRSQQPG